MPPPAPTKIQRVAHPLQPHRKGWVIERSETAFLHPSQQSRVPGAPYLDFEMWASRESGSLSSAFARRREESATAPTLHPRRQPSSAILTPCTKPGAGTSSPHYPRSSPSSPSSSH